jgi:hypothetical protein
MKNKQDESAYGVILFVVFLILKLTSNIDWSWWWVTSPLWIPLVIVLPITLVDISIQSLIRKKTKTK